MKKKFRIRGVEKASLDDVEKVIEADTAANAKVKAELAGLVVTEVIDVGPAKKSMGPVDPETRPMTPEASGKLSTPIEDETTEAVSTGQVREKSEDSTPQTSSTRPLGDPIECAPAEGQIDDVAITHSEGEMVASIEPSVEATSIKSKSAGLPILLLLIGWFLHVLVCAESPLVNRDLAFTALSWAGALGNATAMLLWAFVLGLFFKLLPRYRELWVVPWTIGIYILLVIRVGSISLVPSNSPLITEQQGRNLFGDLADVADALLLIEDDKLTPQQLADVTNDLLAGDERYGEFSPLMPLIVELLANFALEANQRSVALESLGLEMMLSPDQLLLAEQIRQSKAKLRDGYDALDTFESGINRLLQSFRKQVVSADVAPELKRRFLDGWERSLEPAISQVDRLVHIARTYLTDIEELLDFMSSRTEKVTFDGSFLRFVEDADATYYNRLIARFASIAAKEQKLLTEIDRVTTQQVDAMRALADTGDIGTFESFLESSRQQATAADHSVHLKPSGIEIFGTRLSFPLHLDDLNQILGPPSRTLNLANTISVWDNIGLLAYSAPGSDVVDPIAITLNHSNTFDFWPLRQFSGELMIDGIRIDDLTSPWVINHSLSEPKFQRTKNMLAMDWALKFDTYRIVMGLEKTGLVDWISLYAEDETDPSPKQKSWLDQYIEETEQLLASDAVETDYDKFIETLFRQHDEAMVRKARSNGDLKGETAIIAEATQIVGERLMVATRLQASAQQAFINGPFDISSFSPLSPENLEAQIELARQWRLAGKLKASILETTLATFEQILATRVSASTLDAAIRGYGEGLQPELQLQMNLENATACQAMMDTLSLLHTTWGEWTYNADQDELTFDADPDGELSRRYESSLLKAALASIRSEELMQKYLAIIKARFGQSEE